jgi:pyruvate ferredoxin oxidoreductase beta subunit
MGVLSGLFPLFEILEGHVTYTHDARRQREPVEKFLMAQGRFAHLTKDDVRYIQKMVDEMWEEWDVPGVVPTKGSLKT